VVEAGFGRLELERAVERPYRRSSAQEPNVLLIVMDTLRATSSRATARRSTRRPRSTRSRRAGILYERRVRDLELDLALDGVDPHRPAAEAHGGPRREGLLTSTASS
jgi:hypothetical protein